MQHIRSSVLAVAMVMICAPLLAQVPASSSGASAGAPVQPTLLQFDQLRVPILGGQSLPPPGAFEQQYASAEQMLKGDTLDQVSQASGELQSKMPKPESMAHVQGKAAGMAGVELAEGLALRQVPVVGMVVDTVQGSIISGVHKKHEERLQQALQQYSQTMMSLYQRPQLLHVSILGNRLRVVDADTHEITLVQPDRQRIVVLTPFDKTYTIQPLAAGSLSQTRCDAAPRDVSSLGATQVAGLPTQGYLFHESGTSDSGPVEITVTRYVSEYTLPLEAMNALLGVDCAAGSVAIRDAPGGATHLALYASYAHAAPTAEAMPQGTPPGMQGMMAMTSPQIVLWRGHLHSGPADPALFEIPPDYTQAAAVSLSSPPASSASSH